MADVRRSGSLPSLEQITELEGVVIVDSPQPAGPAGVSGGLVAVVGEFVDASRAVETNASGVVQTNFQPVLITSGAEQIEYTGGFDATIGEFGGDGGNGFVAIRNKTFARGLVLVPVDNVSPTSGSQNGVRLVRELPTNKSATSATPVVPMSSGVVAAGREFKSGANRIRLAQKVTFADTAQYLSGTDGAVTPAGLPASTQSFVSAGANWIVNGAKKGDIISLGVIGAAGAQGTNAATLRIVSVTDATTVVLQRLDGANFTTGNWIAGTALAWRAHVAATADTGGEHQLSEVQGYTILARPLDATIAAATVCAPTVVPPANASDSWDVLSGLQLVAMPGGSGGLTYSANIHAPNAAQNADMDARYTAAIDALLTEAYPQRDVSVVVSARSSAAINSKIRSHVLVSSSRGSSRMGLISPPVDQLSLTTITGDSSPGVGAARDERVVYCWPGVQTSIPEALNTSLATATGSTTTDGVLDIQSNTWLASIFSNLAPEKNPAQEADPVPTLMSLALGIQRGVSLTQDSYKTLRSRGVCAPRVERSTGGVVFQSGVTSSLTTGQKNIFRRRMADFIQDSLAVIAARYSKLVPTQATKDSFTIDCAAFLENLKSKDNPAAQRISDYVLDARSANTAARKAANVYALVVKVELLGTMDTIVLQTEIGQGVLA